MSSDRSSTCPQCEARRRIEQATHDQFVKDSYGKIPLDQYEALKTKRPKDITATTMGEYYQWWFAEGKFKFTFHFSCDVCGLYWDHKGEVDCPLDLTVEKDDDDE